MLFLQLKPPQNNKKPTPPYVALGEVAGTLILKFLTYLELLSPKVYPTGI